MCDTLAAQPFSPLSMTQPPDFDALFSSVMPNAKGACLRTWCDDHRVTPEALMGHRFVDEHGYAWSVMSWVGALMLGRYVDQNTHLLTEALELYRETGLYKQGVSHQTHPGDPDLLWGWLGHYSIFSKPSKDSFYQALSGLMAYAGTPFSLEPDGQVGGWVLPAMELLERRAPELPTTRYLDIACHLVRQLVFSPRITAQNHPQLRKMEGLMPNGERIPRIGPCVHDEELLKEMVVPILDRTAALIPAFFRSNDTHGGPSLLLNEALSTVPDPEFWKNAFSDFGEAQWEAVGRLIKVGLLDFSPKYSNLSGAAGRVFFLCGQHLTPEEEQRLHHRLTAIPLDESKRVDDPRNTLAGWFEWNKVPALVGWLRAVMLEHGLPAPIKPLAKPRF